MSNERADEFLCWRGRLTAPDALPEQGLEDKELSWQRLAERMQKQPRRHYIAWWIAAACLILAFFLPTTHLFHGRPAHPGRPNRVATRTPARIPVAPGGAADRAVANPIDVRPGGHPIHAGHPAHSNYGEIAAITISPIADTVATIAPTLLLAGGRSGSDLSAGKSGSDLAGNPPAHHALRIVYFNELNNNSAPAPSFATRQPSFLHLVIASAGTGTTGTGTAGAGNWTPDATPNPLIKIAISSPHH
jgi:hypothetical protein